MRHIYVRELFGLLRFLDIEQLEVIAALRSNKTQVSLWANGKRPLPSRTAPAFFAYMARTITAYAAAAWESNQAPGSPSLLGPPASAERWEEAVLLHLHRWEIECSAARGDLSKSHESYRDILRPYYQIDLVKLSDHEFTAYMVALRGMYRTGRLLAHLRERTDLTEGRYLSPPFRTDITPLDYFWHIVSQYGVEAGNEQDDDD